MGQANQLHRLAKQHVRNGTPDRHGSSYGIEGKGLEPALAENSKAHDTDGHARRSKAEAGDAELGEFGKRLRQIYQDTVDEPIPDEMKSLLDRLDDNSNGRSDGAS
ncbi:hypothetical protein GCM10011367_17530 [Marinicauda pacifica]|uniref:Anti-sigma factor NepR domain-containing protein n=1 Tax=Marinicauda pacifica TaxID=1133559 RepID=A0A4S2HB49_9PROT|nr:NepR family anti-sigma factor [Marinicauda pacifica]TGY93157.1 hypothetical protein E5162_08835 [Marinicauda pacifica]GGE43343.1 hypothetical protein GCM10011367_17530 [Marinicauda pacifica]